MQHIGKVGKTLIQALGASLLISATAYAQPAASGVAGLMSFLPFIALFAFMYFMVIRPQMKRTKEHRALIDALGAGSEVVFAGGLMGVIKKLEGEYAVVTIASGVDVKVQKASVISVLPPETLKNI